MYKRTNLVAALTLSSIFLLTGCISMDDEYAYEPPKEKSVAPTEPTLTQSEQKSLNIISNAFLSVDATLFEDFNDKLIEKDALTQTLSNFKDYPIAILLASPKLPLEGTYKALDGVTNYTNYNALLASDSNGTRPTAPITLTQKDYALYTQHSLVTENDQIAYSKVTTTEVIKLLDQAPEDAFFKVKWVRNQRDTIIGLAFNEITP